MQQCIPAQLTVCPMLLRLSENKMQGDMIRQAALLSQAAIPAWAQQPQGGTAIYNNSSHLRQQLHLREPPPKPQPLSCLSPAQLPPLARPSPPFRCTAFLNAVWKPVPQISASHGLHCVSPQTLERRRRLLSSIAPCLGCILWQRRLVLLCSSSSSSMIMVACKSRPCAGLMQADLPHAGLHSRWSGRMLMLLPFG